MSLEDKQKEVRTYSSEEESLEVNYNKLSEQLFNMNLQLTDLIKAQKESNKSICQDILDAFFDNSLDEVSQAYVCLGQLFGDKDAWYQVAPKLYSIINTRKKKENLSKKMIRHYLANQKPQPEIEAVMAQPKKEPAPINKEKDSFHQRVKDIICKAATKNGQRIETFAKGHERSYIFHVDAELFCEAMDVLLTEHEGMVEEFLDGNLHSTQLSKVCFFIGRVVEMHLINDKDLQLTDLLFAFEDYYPSKSTIRTKLSAKDCTTSQKVFLNTFQGLLRRFKNRK